MKYKEIDAFSELISYTVYFAGKQPNREPSPRTRQPHRQPLARRGGRLRRRRIRRRMDGLLPEPRGVRYPRSAG